MWHLEWWGSGTFTREEGFPIRLSARTTTQVSDIFKQNEYIWKPSSRRRLEKVIPGKLSIGRVLVFLSRCSSHFVCCPPSNWAKLPLTEFLDEVSVLPGSIFSQWNTRAAFFSRLFRRRPFWVNALGHETPLSASWSLPSKTTLTNKQYQFLFQMNNKKAHKNTLSSVLKRPGPIQLLRSMRRIQVWVVTAARWSNLVSHKGLWGDYFGPEPE